MLHPASRLCCLTLEMHFTPFPEIIKVNQHAISINKQWRVGFEWQDGNAYHVKITDYHWGVPMRKNDMLDPIYPGEILREDFLEPMGISIKQLSRELSVPPNRISEIVNGKRAITADTALRLQRYFGVEAQFWLNLQTEYDLRMMKRKIWADIEQRIIPVKHPAESIQLGADG